MSLIQLVYFYIFPVLFGCSMFGWGKIFSFNKTSNYISITIVLGMGLTLFIGGILNNLYLANQSNINIIFFLGLLLFFLDIYKKRNHIKQFSFIKFEKRYFVFLIPIFLLSISVISSINPEAYNYHDDYQKYFIHPVKMLESGSVFGSTLSAIGLQTFGGQSFFQSFFISFLGLKGINIFDSVFSLSICVLLIFELSKKQKKLIFGLLIACVIILIHPQIVNISSVYSATLLMMISIILTFEFFREKNEINSTSSNISLILGICICFASLIILKSSYAIFPIIYFISLTILLFIFKISKKKIILFFFITPLVSLVLFIPWVLFSLELYTEANLTTNEPLDLTVKVFKFYFPNLLSFEPLFLGGRQLIYTLLPTIGIFLMLLTIFLLKKQKFEFKKNDQIIIFVSSAALITGSTIYFFLMFIGPNFSAIETLTRYSIPFIIATIPVGIFLLYSLILTNYLYIRSIFFIFIILISIILFPQYYERIVQRYKCGSQLSFSLFACSEEYIEYNNSIFQKAKKISTQKWQEEIPEGKSVMVWINTPFYLNYKRNEIIEINIGGFDNPWAVFPSAKYMILEYNSFATRSLQDLQYMAKTSNLIDAKIAIRTIEHLQKIKQLFNANKIRLIQDDGVAVIFEIK